LERDGEGGVMGRGRKAKTEDRRKFDEWLGDQICKARAAKGISQAELAEVLQIGRKQLYWYEVGRCAIPLYLVGRMSKALEMPVSVFIQHG
jgi:transcriptional regulator with XRE-family HTH domain